MCVGVVNLSEEFIASRRGRRDGLGNRTDLAYMMMLEFCFQFSIQYPLILTTPLDISDWHLFSNHVSLSL